MFKLSKRSKEIISIQIESNSIKFALGKCSKDTLVVHKLHREDLANGVYENGMPLDKSAFKAAIEQGIRQLHTRTKNVTISIESSEILKREIQVPKVDDNDLKDLVRFEVSQYLPINVEDYVLQHQVISVATSEEETEVAEKLNVLIVAMPIEMSLYYYELFTDLKLEPVGMDLAGNNAVKLVKFGMNDMLTNSTAVMLDLAYSNIEVTVLDGGLNKLNRLINLGPKHIDEQVMDKLNTSHELSHKLVMRYLDISIDELIEAYKAYDLLSESKDTGVDDISIKDLNQNAAKKMIAVEEIVDQFQEIFNELEKVFKYYTFKERGNKIDRIFVYGDYANIPDFQKNIQERLDISTNEIALDQLSGVNIKPKITDLSSYIGAIGGLIIN